MKNMKKLHTSIMCLLFVLALTFTALAADSTVTYKGRDNGFEYGPGSVYVDTDLFDDFKDVMPGDVKAETVTITNDLKNNGYIKVYMGALLHDKENNPISPKVLEKLAADDRKGTMDELTYMHKFLDQLTLKVWNGEKKDENLIYSGKPNSLENGFAEGNVYLGLLRYGEKLDLNVELAVNIEMGNEYADRIGEVDWVFVVEEYVRRPGSGSDDPVKKPNKDVITDDYGNLSVKGEVEEDEFQLNVLPMTGDNTMIWPYVIVGLMALIGLIILLRKKKEEEE